jgi:threonyl-tRNA synthetase
VMIHRAILGSLERFLGILIEHYAGLFPLWLAPEQIRVMPISEKTNEYAESLLQKLKSSGLRATLDVSDDKIGAKIARAHADHIPYMLVVGPKESEQGAVNVRIRQSQTQVTIPAERFINKAAEKVALKTVELNLE